jgi:hypothetical protein
MALELELKTYSDKLHELLTDEGKFVVIKGDAVLGVFESYADALKVAYDKAGLEPFLVKQIAHTEQISYVTRHIQFDDAKAA